MKSDFAFLHIARTSIFYAKAEFERLRYTGRNTLYILILCTLVPHQKATTELKPISKFQNFLSTQSKEFFQLVVRIKIHEASSTGFSKLRVSIQLSLIGKMAKRWTPYGWPLFILGRNHRILSGTFSMGFNIEKKNLQQSFSLIRLGEHKPHAIFPFLRERMSCFDSF